MWYAPSATRARMSKIKKKKKSLWCPARTAELVQVTEWPGEAGQDSAAIPEASSRSSGCPFCFLWAQHTVLCFEKWLFSVQCFSVPPGTLRKRRVPTERCRKPPGARVIRSVPASTLQHTLDASSGEVAAGPQLFKCCCQAGQCGRPTAG